MQELSDSGTDWLKSVSQLWQNELIKNAIILLVIYFVLSFISSYLKKSINRKFEDNSTRLKLRTSVSLSMTLLLVLTAMTLFSSRLSSFTVALGVAGAGIAFALQEVIASLAGWFAIHFSKFFIVGDRVLLGGIKGDVIDIGFLRTTVMELGAWVGGDQYNGRVVRIANSFVFKEPVYNYSADFPFVWDEISISIKHGSDLQTARQLIKRTADAQLDAYEAMASAEWKKLVEKYVIENAIVDNQVYMTADSNGVNFTLRYVTDFKKRRKTKDQLFEKILEEISLTENVAISGTTIEVTGLINDLQ